MIVYFDTSAVVPLLVRERGTDTCRRLWHDADRRVTSRLTYVEVAAALVAAERRGRLTAAEHPQVWDAFVALWPDVDVVEVTEGMVTAGADLSRSWILRGYDAMHCASAAAVNDDELVSASGDQRLLAAWLSLGIAVVDTSA